MNNKYCLHVVVAVEQEVGEDAAKQMMMMTTMTMMMISAYVCMYIHMYMNILLCTCLLLRGGLFVLFKRCCCPLLIMKTHTNIHLLTQICTYNV